MEKAIITVVDRDQVGIIAHVCQFLSKANIIPLLIILHFGK